MKNVGHNTHYAGSVIENMNDWKKDLKALATNLRQNQKNKKRERSKFEDMENFRGRKGFNDTGIALTEKTVKQQRKNKLSYKKYNYAGSRLNFINDARAEAARERRLSNPDHKKRIDTVLEIADERIAEKDREQRQQREVYRFRNRESSNGSFFIGKVPAAIGADREDGSVEIDLDRYRSVDQEPTFKNKVEESIYRLTKENLKKQ